MIEQTDLAGGFTLPATSLKMSRMGYGAMQLAGPGVWGHHGTSMPPLLFFARQ
jgi:hypothetical protein